VYWRASRMVRVSRTEVGDNLTPLLGELAALKLCQSDGTFITTVTDRRERLAETTQPDAVAHR
jgi:hypothetical protein